NPGSPCGTLHPSSALRALQRPGRVVVVDEAFMTMVPGEPMSLAREALDDVVVVRSLTKLLSIPGLRAGYAIAPAHLADRLRAGRRGRPTRSPWSHWRRPVRTRTSWRRPPSAPTARAPTSRRGWGRWAPCGCGRR